MFIAYSFRPATLCKRLSKTLRVSRWPDTRFAGEFLRERDARRGVDAGKKSVARKTKIFALILMKFICRVLERETRISIGLLRLAFSHSDNGPHGNWRPRKTRPA